ncbi:MAG: PAS domain S-box protein [Bacteroidota bacterium]
MKSIKRISGLRNRPALAVAVIALLVLVGWQFQIRVLKNPFRVGVDTNPLSAFCFVVSALGFILRDRLARPAAIILLVLAGGKLITWLAGIPFAPEEWIYGATLGNSRIAPNTAISFLLVAVTLLFPRKIFVQYIGLGLFFMGILNFLGYLYNIRLFYEWKNATPLPFYSAVCFFLLSLQVLFSQHRIGFMRELSASLAGGIIARKVLPIIFTTCVVIGVMMHFLLQSQLRNEIEAAVLVFFLIVASVLTSWYLAVLLNRKERADKTAAALLRKTDQKEIVNYKYTLDESAIVAITDQTGRIQYVNDNFCKISGYSSEELVGKDHRIINSGYHPPEFIRNLWRTIASGQIWRGEICNRRKDKSLYWVDTTIVPFVDDDGKPYRYTAIRFDITEKKLGEEVLAQAQIEKEQNRANLMTILNTTDIAFVLVDHEGNVASFNSRAAEFCQEQFEKEIIKGGRAVDYFAKGRQSFISSVMDRAMNGTDTRFEVRYPQPAGGYRWFQVKWSGVKNEDGQVLGLLLAIWDITLTKQAQAEKDRITADLIHRNKDLERFTYIVSHNLRAPAANIMGLLSLLKQSETNDASLLEALLASSKSLDTIIHDLNQTLQITHHIDEKKEPVSLPELSMQVQESMRELLAHNEVIITEHFSDDAKTIYTIRGYLQSVFYQLMQNSIKYRRQEVPMIHISSQRRKDRLLLHFTDNGKGIDLDRYGNAVFGLYKRFDFTVEGKGMGLFMAKMQVEALGGQISVVSKPGLGSEFMIDLPVGIELMD